MGLTCACGRHVRRGRRYETAESRNGRGDEAGRSEEADAVFDRRAVVSCRQIVYLLRALKYVGNLQGIQEQEPELG